MRIEILPSGAGGPSGRFFLSTFLVDGRVAIDAGALGAAPIAVQRGVSDVLLSHSHLDHVATLPSFLENVFRPEGPAPVVHGGAACLASLREDVLNERVWPDLVRLTAEGVPLITLRELTPGETVTVAGLRVTPIPTDHVVPSLGYLLEDHGGRAFVAADTGPTTATWERLREHGGADLVFLEVSFPDRLAAIATASRHLCPATFAGEVAKLAPGTRVVVVHVKPAYHEEVEAEVRALALPAVELGRPGTTYTWGQA